MLATAYLFTSCNQQPNEQTEIRSVKANPVVVSSDTKTEILTGIVNAGIEASPAFRISGIIANIYIKEGDYVKEGDLIAELDPRDFQEAASAATSKYEQVNSEVERVVKLYERNSVAKNEYEKAISGRESVRAINETAQNQLKDTKLFSPISGYVQSVNFGLKQMVTPASGVANIVNTATLSVETNISAGLYIKRDQFASFVGHYDLFDEPIPLTLTYLSPKANNSQLYKIRLNIDPQKQQRLAPGMAMEIVLSYKNDTKQEISVPLPSVFYEKGNEFVWVIDTTTMTVKKRQIETSTINKNGLLIINKGLTGNELIVTAGVSELVDNQKIKILQAASATNIGKQL